jgi:hypothetical protein
LLFHNIQTGHDGPMAIAAIALGLSSAVFAAKAIIEEIGE